VSLLLGILEQGIIYAIMALGVYITYKILDFPDLTVDSSFPLGAAVTATMLLSGQNPFVTLLASFAAGCVAGVVTGVIHVKFGVRDLLSGIITMTALYSINLHVAGGKANLPFFTSDTIFKNSLVNSIFTGEASRYAVLVVSLVVALVAKLLLDAYLKTKSGYLLRAAGDNSNVVTALAKDCGSVKILGLAISNGLVALSGSVLSQQQRFFDVTMGTGTIVMGLAIVIIGTNIFRNISFVKATSAVFVGSILYKACVSIAISCGLSSNDMKLVTAVLFLAILVAGNLKKGGKIRA
jgi:putative ABC transport system permease protein